VTRKELAQNIFKACHITGEFKLRSGATSHEYFDKYRFEAQPQILAAVAEHMKSMIPSGTEVIAGLEMGGIPLVTALSLATGIPAAFVRKKAKDYGTCLFAEGSEIKGKKVCIIEDVITSGGQVILSTKDLREAGAQVEHVICAILREPKSEALLAKENLKLHPLFTGDELKNSI